jgi:hypothetical protein
MHTETLRRKDKNKSSKILSSPKNQTRNDLKEEVGKKAGVPLFLKRTEPIVQRQPLEEEEELLQPKTEEVPVQRQPMEEEEEEELLQAKPEGAIQRQPLEEEEELLQPKIEEGPIQRQPLEEEEEEELLQPKRDGTTIQGHSAGENPNVQRDETSGQPETGSGLTPPSLLQPRRPYGGLHLMEPEMRFELDPEIMAMARSYVRRHLEPISVQEAMRHAAVETVAGSRPETGGSPITGTGSPSAPATEPSTEAESPTPEPGPGETSPAPREGSVGDVLGAVAATEPVATMLESLRSEAEGRVEDIWSGASAGERAAIVTSGVVLGAGALTTVLALPDARDRVLPLLNGRVIPVPGVEGLGVEMHFGGDSLMIGAHLDVGTLLPDWMGFGPSSPTAIGGPPHPQEFVPGQRKAEGSGSLCDQGTGNIGRDIRYASSGGEALHGTVKELLESRLNANLSSVRVNRDSSADRLARSVNARAFTAGSHIFFRNGLYDPDTKEGLQLLAHEMVHTIQQSRRKVHARPVNKGISISEPDDPYEREADDIAEQVVDRKQSVVQRQPAEEEEEELIQTRSVDQVIQRQPEEEGEEIAAVGGEEPKKKVYTVKLSTGTAKDVSAPEAVAFMMQAYNSIRRQIDLAAGEHETLKRSRDQNFWVGTGGFLADTFMGRDIPPLKIWDKPRNMLALARVALKPDSVETAGNALKQAQDAYRDASATYQTYLDELEMASGATQIAIGAIPVAFLVIGVAWVALSGGAAAGGAAAVAEGTAAAEATATGAAATSAAATGAAASTGAAGGAAATATTMATAETVSGIAVQVGGNVAAGNVAAAEAIMMRYAATAGGRRALLYAAQTVAVAMQQKGITRQEFQFLKQLSEMLFLFARGG